MAEAMIVGSGFKAKPKHKPFACPAWITCGAGCSAVVGAAEENAQVSLDC